MRMLLKAVFDTDTASEVKWPVRWLLRRARQFAEGRDPRGHAPTCPLADRARPI
jgi:hypothetical protein